MQNAYLKEIYGDKYSLLSSFLIDIVHIKIVKVLTFKFKTKRLCLNNDYVDSRSHFCGSFYIFLYCEMTDLRIMIIKR